MDDKKNGKLILLRNMSFESETCAVKNWSWLRGMKPHWGGYCRKWPNGRLQCADLGQLEYDKINKIWKQSVLYRICANCFSIFRALLDISMVFCYTQIVLTYCQKNLFYCSTDLPKLGLFLTNLVKIFLVL
jgi:hypothetical protein